MLSSTSSTQTRPCDFDSFATEFSLIEGSTALEKAVFPFLRAEKFFLDREREFCYICNIKLKKVMTEKSTWAWAAQRAGVW